MNVNEKECQVQLYKLQNVKDNLSNEIVSLNLVFKVFFINLLDKRSSIILPSNNVHVFAFPSIVQFYQNSMLTELDLFICCQSIYFYSLLQLANIVNFASKALFLPQSHMLQSPTEQAHKKFVQSCYHVRILIYQIIGIYNLW